MDAPELGCPSLRSYILHLNGEYSDQSTVELVFGGDEECAVLTTD